MLLYLLRHGDAVEQGFDDVSRPLSPLGEEQAANAANYFISLNLSLDLILSSPLLRAKQTAEIIGKVMNVAECRTTEYLVPQTSERELLRQLNECGRNSVLLVGHEPHLRALVSLLVAGSRHANIAVKKGVLLSLETSTPVQPVSAVLKWMLTNEQMKRMQKQDDNLSTD